VDVEVRRGVLMARSVTSESAPAPVGPYSQAILTRPGEILFSAGQIPIDVSTGEMRPGGVKEQTRQVLGNIKAVLESAGFGLSNVVKTTVYMSNLEEFGAMNQVYAEYFSEPYPARSCIEAKALPKGAVIEIDVIAVRESAK
jgi:2-iminobutanoate/2-iminopropanoate deaminase